MSIEGQAQGDRDGPSNLIREAMRVCLEVASGAEISVILQTATEGIRVLTGAQHVSLEVSGVPGAGRYSSDETSGADPPQDPPDPDTPLGPIPDAEAPIGYGRRISGLIRLFGKADEGEFSQVELQAISLVASQVSLIIGRSQLLQETRFKMSASFSGENRPEAILLLEASRREPLAEMLAQDQALSALGVALVEVDDSVGSLVCQSEDGESLTLGEFAVRLAFDAGGFPVFEDTVVGVPDGRSFAVEVGAFPIQRDDGSIAQVLVNVREASPQTSFDVVGTEFWGRVSHYLWRLLTTIKGSAATALGTPVPLDPADFRHVLRIIDQQADHMRDVLGKLLDLTRLELGTLTLAPETIRIAEFVEQISARLSASGASYQLGFAPGPDLPPARVDRERLSQVVERLISLCAVHSDRGSLVDIRAESEGTGILIVIERGDGSPVGGASVLSGESLGRDFDWDTLEFHLDIAICRGIVEAHGGRWIQESRASREADRFAFSLPVGIEGPDAGTATVNPGPVGPRSNERNFPRVLVIDSDPQALIYVQDTLSLAGYSAIATSNLEEVHGLIEAEVPQLVLLELMLPGADGLELIGRIARGLDAPVIFLSDRGREGELEQAFEMGGDDFIVKPFLPAELITRVREVLRKREAQIQPKSTQIYSFQDLEINYAERSVIVAGETVRLSATEYRLLFELSISAGRLLTHTQLLRRVWGSEYGGDKRLVRAFVKNLRRKLGDDANAPKYIFTEAGSGYRMAKP